MLGVGALERRRHQVVLAAGDEQQRRAVVVLVVHVAVVLAGVDVGQRAAPEDRARRGDVVALVERARLLLAEPVRERVVPLLEREADGAVAVGGVLEHREGRLDLRQRHALDALGRGRVDRHADRAEAVVEQDLREHAAGRVAHDDRRRVERADDGLEVLDDLRHRHRLDRGRVGVERLDLDLEAGIGGGEDLEALGLVVGDPVLPAARRDPEAVDEHDRVGRGGCVGHAGPFRGSGLTETSSMPSSWIRSMSPCRCAWSCTSPVRTVWPDRALEVHPLEQQAEAIADLAAEHELVAHPRQASPTRRARVITRGAFHLGEIRPPPPAS